MEDISDKILLYLYKFRNDSDFHDLFEVFDQSQVDVVFDKANELYERRFLEIQPGIYFGDEPRKEKQDFFAQITRSGIEYVKNEIIRQEEIAALRLQKDKDEKRRHRTNAVISVVGVIVLIYSVYQVDKTNELEKQLKKTERERDSLSSDNDSLQRLLNTKEIEIVKLKQRDSLGQKKK